uniref:Uncharacterized protein n=1 Tax=Panagrolaimus sp. ES5 TaxID=591445 RepID=A0AC34GVD1_9BILA
MTTKDNFLFSKNKDQFFADGNYQNNDNFQYSNLNLNQIYKCSDVLSFDHSYNKSKTDKKLESVYLKSRNQSTKNDQYSKTLKSLSFFDEVEKDVKKPGNNNLNNSTLSLHIVAYENSIEASGDTVSVDKNEGLKKNTQLIEKWQNSERIFADSIIQNPFEFPRQQKEGKNVDPEVMQFKASQKLLNPNKSTKSKRKVEYFPIYFTGEEKKIFF